MDTHKVSVCLVDDEKDLIEGFTHALGEQFEVRSFLSPLEALEAFEQGFSPEIVVSDLQMPQMNGLNFIREMKAQGVQTKVVVSSGYADKNAAVTALNLGVNGFLEKPYTLKQFKEMLVKLSPTAEPVRELVGNLRKLSEMYFNRLATAENFIYKKGLTFPETAEEKRELLRSQKEEWDLSNLIEKQFKTVFHE